MATGETPQSVNRPERRLDERAGLWDRHAQENACARIIRYDREGVRHLTQHRSASELENSVLEREVHGGGGDGAVEGSGQAGQEKQQVQAPARAGS